MTLPEIRDVLLWCSIINFGLLIWWLVMFLVARDWIFRIHSRWFVLSRERFDSIHYSGMAMFKLAIFLFNFVPYIALLIVG
jgi:hypothetical protein